jgi:hypothetical protein
MELAVDSAVEMVVELFLDMLINVSSGVEEEGRRKKEERNNVKKSMGKSYEKKSFGFTGHGCTFCWNDVKTRDGWCGRGRWRGGVAGGLGGAAWCSYLGRMFVGEMRFYRYFETIFERCLGPNLDKKRDV